MARTPPLILKHELLSESEARKVAKEYGVTFDKFPKMLETDPQAVKLKAKSGQVVAVHRVDPTGKYMAYRYVVKS
ncbi:MAG: hypothetical protein KGH98_03115 [Candidatus Micrarchaeota archaeon]|nr:hypothetical protein [Candidatus Micrarchaeota archaeon]